MFTIGQSGCYCCGESSRMKDMQAHLEKLRIQIAECEMIRDLATDKAKRELFNRLSEYFKVLAGDIERLIAAGASDTLPGGKTNENFPRDGAD